MGCRLFYIDVTAVLLKKMITFHAKDEVKYKFLAHVNEEYSLDLRMSTLVMCKTDMNVVEDLKKNRGLVSNRPLVLSASIGSFRGESMLSQPKHRKVTDDGAVKKEEGQEDPASPKADLRVITIAGERRLWKLSGVGVQAHNENLRGVLFLTNYRIEFVPLDLAAREDPFIQGLFTIPLGCINQCTFVTNAKEGKSPMLLLHIFISSFALLTTAMNASIITCCLLVNSGNI